MTLCACGCGEEMVYKRHHKQHPPQYKKGHWTRAHPFNKGKITSFKRIPPNTICGCGCGCLVPEYKQSGGARYCRSKDGKFYLLNHRPSIKGELSHKWKGGRYKSSSGYIHIYHPEHPNADKDGYVFEHRYVWEQANGRLLKHNEHIHHINGVRDDNRIENLIALTNSQHMSLEVKLRGGIPTTPESCSRAGRLGAKARWG